jgi:hypothetical protein
LAVVGSDLAAGMRPQLLIPGGAWHVSRLKAARPMRCSARPNGRASTPATWRLRTSRRSCGPGPTFARRSRRSRPRPGSVGLRLELGWPGIIVPSARGRPTPRASPPPTDFGNRSAALGSVSNLEEALLPCQGRRRGSKSADDRARGSFGPGVPHGVRLVP